MFILSQLEMLCTLNWPRQSLPQKHSILKVLLCETEPETIPKIAKHGYSLIYLMIWTQLKHYFLTGYMCLFTIHPLSCKSWKQQPNLSTHFWLGVLLKLSSSPIWWNPVAVSTFLILPFCHSGLTDKSVTFNWTSDACFVRASCDTKSRHALLKWKLILW